MISHPTLHVCGDNIPVDITRLGKDIPLDTTCMETQHEDDIPFDTTRVKLGIC